MKKFVYLLGALLFVLGGVYIHSKRSSSLKIDARNDFAGLCISKDGKMTGKEIEILEKTLNKMGIRYKISVTKSVFDMKQKTNLGTIDMCVGSIIKDKDNKSVSVYSTSYDHVSFGLLHNKQNLLMIKKVGVQDGTNANLFAGNKEVVKFVTFQALLEGLKSGAIDAAIIESVGYNAVAMKDYKFVIIPASKSEVVFMISPTSTKISKAKFDEALKAVLHELKNGVKVEAKADAKVESKADSKACHTCTSKK